MTPFRFLTTAVFLVFLSPPAFAAGTAVMNVSATVISKSNCTFQSTPATLNFGALDPLNPVNVSATTSATFRCVGSADPVVYFVSAPAGSKMTHATVPTAFLPFTIDPVSGSFPRETPPLIHTVTITGHVQGSDYVSALPGAYSATVSLTINP